MKGKKKRRVVCTGVVVPACTTTSLELWAKTGVLDPNPSHLFSEMTLLQIHCPESDPPLHFGLSNKIT